MKISDIPHILKAAFLAGDAVLLKGTHGIGKSDVIDTFAQDNVFHLEVLFLSHQEIGDLIGMPKTMEVHGEHVTIWTKPIWLQRMEHAAKQGKPCILFCDELNRAHPDVLQSALQLVLKRQIHEHRLPECEGKKSLVVAAINPEDDYQVIDLDPALLDRFLSVEVETEIKDWLQWARGQGIAEVITDFLAEHPALLEFKPESDHELKGATPRGWAKLSEHIPHFESIPQDVRYQIIKGKIGSAVGAQFFAYYQQYEKAIKIGDLEELVQKVWGVTHDIEAVGRAVYEITGFMETVWKYEMIDKLCSRSLDASKSTEDILPLLGFLYSVEIEILASFLKTLKEQNPERYRQLAELDIDKGLFKKIVLQTEGFKNL